MNGVGITHILDFIPLHTVVQYINISHYISTKHKSTRNNSTVTPSNPTISYDSGLNLTSDNATMYKNYSRYH